MMMKRKTFWIVLALIVITVSLEVSLRILGVATPPLFQADPEIGYMMVPEQNIDRFGRRIYINRFHQRSEELAEKPAPGTERVMFLGDSVTFGIANVDQSQTYPEIVGATLRKSGKSIEVANASAVSWGIGNERAYIARFGTFGSKFIVLEIGSSDLLQPSSTGATIDVNPAQPSKPPVSAIGEVFTRFLIPRVKDALGFPDPFDNEPVSTEAREKQFNVDMDHFRGLVALVREQGTQPVVMLVPGEGELLPEAQRFTRYEPYRARFLQIVQSLSLPIINLAPEWEAKPDMHAYFNDGTHLTVLGNQVVAARIVEELSKLDKPEQPKNPLSAQNQQ
ncbi:SGNH/GDSL hydrolase family protein [Rhizobium sp. BK376]|uniref:SGNH/GDSL hydrolase family protein n=1 Tax=Rhizobium sp. BK376 TaxID=2512149 RepID=UPI00104BDD55|nr:SGNH/GDSL hydrolase family protein [Rhizobium sp. BK376]